MNNTIPRMCSKLGRYWAQPSCDRILVDDTHAVMDRQTWAELCEYNTSLPTGAYEGKMWKRLELPEEPEEEAAVILGSDPTRLICWYGPSEEVGYVSVNYRRVLLI